MPKQQAELDGFERETIKEIDEAALLLYEAKVDAKIAAEKVADAQEGLNHVMRTHKDEIVFNEMKEKYYYQFRDGERELLCELSSKELTTVKEIKPE